MPSAAYRLAKGGRINREQPMSFTFDGKRFSGYAGDTLASALLAGGRKVLGRSFKYHRPRGVLSAGVEECNALVRLESGPLAEPNVRATLAPLYEGLSASSQNCWPSVEWDINSVIGWFARLLPAGFYYKTFIWPSWHFWEGFVRRAAGIGKIPEAADQQEYHKRNAHCDVLVVGAGPAGLMAALAAARSGAQVILVDEQEEPGGSLLWERDRIDGLAAEKWLERALEELVGLENLRLISRCTATGYYDHNVLILNERVSDHLGRSAPQNMPRQRLWKVRAKQVVLATGAIERPLVFANNDRPGIMLASAVRQYVNRYGVAPGARVVIACNNDNAYRTALDLAEVGVEVVAVVDARAAPDGALVLRAREAGITLLQGSCVTDTRGRQGVSAVRVGPVPGAAPVANAKRKVAWLDCDLLAMSGGWNPVVHLYSQSGGKLDFVESSGVFVPRAGESLSEVLHTAGCINGSWSLHGCLSEGLDAGIGAAAKAGCCANSTTALPASENTKEEPMLPLWNLVGNKDSKQWVDFQHDVTVSDIYLSARENFVSVEHFKRYTTTGMSVDQGKTSNINGLATLAQALGKNIPEVGTTKFRPPYTPVSLGNLAGPDIGRFYRPRREMPCQDWHTSHGAHFDDAGLWPRPACYAREGESHAAAIEREIATVRNAVGLFEGSPLGKIEVNGKDAAAFLNRIYMNNVPSLKVGSIRYALVLNDGGTIVDDGVFTRLAEDHFLLSPSSASADRFFATLEEWHQTAWPHYDVLITPVTSQWATLTVSGPRARNVLQHLASDIDFAKEAFPHMSYRAGRLEGVACRIARVSFTGEVSYEVNVPACYAESLWDALLAAGKPHGISPYGLEALITLRLEKGYLHIGGDTDGNTIPDDIGWGGPSRKKAVDYIGKRSLDLPVFNRGKRQQLVGFRLRGAQGRAFLPVGAHCVEPADTSTGLRSTGYVTSSCFSPTLQQDVAIGRIENGRDRMGEEVSVYYDGKTYSAEIVSPVFYDTEGERLHA